MTRYNTLADLQRHISPDVRIVETRDQLPPVVAPAEIDAALLSLGYAGALGGAQVEAPPATQRIVLPLPPSANRYWRVCNGRVVVSESAKTYKAGVWMVAQHAGMRPFTGPVAVRVHVYRARKVGDLDNFAKVTLDALQGIAYQDDAQIVELHSWRHDDKDNPRVEVEVMEVRND